MLHPEDIDWLSVDGISYSGQEIQSALQELVGGRLSEDEQIDLMVEFFREGRATTAGYAAIPTLLSGDAPDARTAWLMAHFACVVIGASRQEGNPPVPGNLLVNVDDRARQIGIQMLFKAVADADLRVAELLDSLSSALLVLERPDLSGAILEMALKEYGVSGRDSDSG